VNPSDVRRFKARITAGFSIILFILVLGFVTSFLLINRATQTKDSMVRVEMEQTLDATHLLALNAKMSADHRTYLLTGDRTFIAQWEDDRQEYARTVAKLKEVVTPFGRGLVERAEKLERELNDLEQESVEIRAKGPLSLSMTAQLAKKLVPLRQNIVNTLRELLQHKASLLEEKKAVALQATATMKLWVTITTAVALLLSLIVGIIYSRKLVGLHVRLADAYSTVQEHEQSLKRAIRARDEMVAVISHELKNPLTALGTGITLTQRLLPKDVALQNVRDVLNRIQPSLHRMNRLIADLLDITRIEARTLRVKPASTDLAATVAEVIHTYESLALDKSIELKAEITTDAQAIFGDKDRVAQVLSNLVHNAIKFTLEGGKITVRATRVGEKVQIQVVDTGKGIPPEYLPLIFDRFWQAKDTAYMGTGLGLAIAKGLVEALGGKIWVESKAGEGSTFTFTLPTVQQRTQAKIA